MAVHNNYTKMSWSTDLFCPITFSRKTYRHISEVESDHEEICNLIKVVERRLHDLAVMTEPQKMFPHAEDVLAEVSAEVDRQLDELRDYIEERWKLELLIEYWQKCHAADGRPIALPDAIGWDDAFISGDYLDGDD